jgi:isopentenyl diphosphate isomerase/L-lactate dehydrogenase-like FMN-dependent dehydrogenase
VELLICMVKNGAMTFDGRFVTVADYESYCRQITAPAQYDFLYGEQGDPNWSTYTSNRTAFAAQKLRPRVLTGAPEPDLRTTLLGHELSLPVVLGPTGGTSELNPDAELAAIRAAGAVGTLYAVPSFPTETFTDVAAAATGPWWWQTFLFRDRAITEWHVRQAVELGASALVVTVSAGDLRFHQTRRFLPDQGAIDVTGGLRHWSPPGSDFRAGVNWNAGWEELDWVGSLSDLPLVLKGIQTAEDARLCLEHGVSGIVVSNHGGRFLQGARATVEALPEIVDAVDGRIEVSLDGGVRQGQDVLKALALGARTVWIGRAARWGQAVRGQAGIEHVVEILREELRGAMILCGLGSVSDVDRSLVTRDAVHSLES